ncbi:NrdH-redoxin [Arthrobacter woluwensis]|uniref:glutaredoxin domain-containing protein n=1 Tax=Arthrobacter woluwensis TaxID=156980 RepID=UPI000D127310|nr:glutaredoxin domain-containing protein [Arthrobacter woluwensis]PSS43612.1 NrdH-redoxin [Arthrobacter woluwensis]
MPNHAETIQQRDGVAVVIYEKPNCVQCTQTKRLLTREGIVYGRVDLTQDPEALEFVKSLGHLAAPVVYVSAPQKDYDWAGFRPDLVRTHITHRTDAT